MLESFLTTPHPPHVHELLLFLIVVSTFMTTMKNASDRSVNVHRNLNPTVNCIEMGLFKRIACAMGISRGQVRILVIGLDNSGKSTLVEHMKPKKANVFEPTPTVGFQVEEFAKGSLNFTVFDMSGQSRYRALWEHYFCDVHAIIFVVDSTDRIRMGVVKEELDEVVRHKEVQSSGLPILIYANKIDLPGSLSPQECVDELGIAALVDTPWHIEGSNALNGSGVEEGVNWLIGQLSSRGRMKGGGTRK